MYVDSVVMITAQHNNGNIFIWEATYHRGGPWLVGAAGSASQGNPSTQIGPTDTYISVMTAMAYPNVTLWHGTAAKWTPQFPLQLPLPLSGATGYNGVSIAWTGRNLVATAVGNDPICTTPGRRSTGSGTPRLPKRSSDPSGRWG